MAYQWAERFGLRTARSRAWEAGCRGTTWGRGRSRRLHEDEARFYAAEVVAVLEHLHSLGIVDRDLKARMRGSPPGRPAFAELRGRAHAPT